MTDPSLTTVDGIYREVRATRGNPQAREFLMRKIKLNNGGNDALVAMLLTRVAQQYGDDWETRE